MFGRTQVGLLIGTGWLPDDYLIDEAKRFGAFENCDQVICLEGPPVIDRQVAMYIYLNMEKKENWQHTEEGLLYKDFNMGSGRKMWAIYPK